MNVLIFWNFSRFFLIFYKFIWIYFELKRIKKIKFYRMLTWHERKGRRHVVAYECTTWRKRMCARVCAHACARTSVIREIKHPF